MADLSLKLTAFEGPLDLLLHLIERDKVDIYDIPIAAVTEQYISYLRSMSEFDMEVASDFLVMAATLLQIKSRMLLPKQSVEGEEEEADPRQQLVEMAEQGAQSQGLIYQELAQKAYADLFNGPQGDIFTDAQREDLIQRMGVACARPAQVVIEIGMKAMKNWLELRKNE